MPVNGSAWAIVRKLEESPQPIVAFARDYPAGYLIERHQHDRAQLIHASAGIMRVDTPSGIWVVPPMRAIWVPSQVPHEIRANSAVKMRTLFFRPDARSDLPTDCCVIEVTPLLREMILRMVALTEAEPRVPPSVHLIELILSEIREIGTLPLHIPMPEDTRVRRICQAILQDPADCRTSAEWGATVGASSRTLERLFHKETGITFGSWRRQARLLAAMTQLAAGRPVGNVAGDLGYDSPSAFTAMFKRVLGHPPSQFCPSLTQRELPTDR
ncbi:AraC family transcriptional regulator [Steroidobacter agaridevorans]|uniref:AraC family transcriptional regulator n=1 Tax=Steroidobacter agaridevorans TaxID=2695856 RepID=UPI001321BEF4|nr:helix-turn-helix transcriptional regulator [Steroidobacter agaridevorans]GFE87525.1 AraC family transcriptional regulator [Steroidobacter agaridevorans]